MTIPLKCACGAVQGAAEVSRKLGSRIICDCDDCQAYAHILGKGREILNENGGTDVFGVKPKRLRTTKGISEIRCVRISAKGMYRWFTGCCKTPIVNSMPSPKMPFAGVLHTFMDHAGHGRRRDEDLGPVAAGVMGRFASGEPLVALYVLSAEEREALRAYCGPKPGSLKSN